MTTIGFVRDAGLGNIEDVQFSVFVLTCTRSSCDKQYLVVPPASTS